MLPAQAGGHPHVAPLAPGFHLNIGTPSKVSPLMNEPDGIWNMGEAPERPDKGGVIDRDLTAGSIVQPTFVPLLSGSGWHNLPTSPTTVVHYVGSFRNQATPTHPDDELRASFEVVAPLTIEPGMKVVVALFTQATFGGDHPLFPHGYPGDPAYHDLWVTGGGGAHVDAVTRNLASPPGQYRVVGVQFVPRWTHRPIAATIQRLRQARYATEYLLGQAPYNIQKTDIAYHVGCSSFGGYTAQMAPIYYPQEFHAATASAYSGAHRSMPSDFDSLLFATSLLGQDTSAHSYTMRDTLDIPIWCRTEVTDFASASFTNRWSQKDQSGQAATHIQRPIYFVLGDEDTVTHGTDWVPILNQAAEADGRLKEFGFKDLTTPNTNTVRVRWSVVSKSSHGEHRINEFTLMDNPTRQTDNLDDVTDLMIKEAYLQLVAGPMQPILPIDNPALGRQLANQATLPSLDPSRQALSHRDRNLRDSQYDHGTRPNLLVENAAFQRNGQGTWLGANESLKVARIGDEQSDSIFVGSADGFVTRLTMVPTATNPPIKPLVEVCRTNRDFASGNQPYCLGHGTWGLAVGDVDPALGGLEVVVGSYNHIALFHADNLKWIREVTLPGISSMAAKAWEYDNPRKIQIGDMLDLTGEEIVFRTLHGHLVIMDRYLAIQHEHGEGGVIDFVVGPSVNPPGAWIRRPLYLLSARGHIVRLEFDPAALFPKQGVLAAASHLEYGTMRDLDLLPWAGQQVLGALFLHHMGTTDAVRLFSMPDCTKIGQFGDLMHNPPIVTPPEVPLPPIAAKHASATGDMEPSLTYVAGHGADRYVISAGGDVSVWDGETVLGHKRLGTFFPALGHGCVQAAEIDDSSPGQEIVVATTAGRVVWLKLSELTTAGTILSIPRTILEDNGRVFEDRCNVSLSATWAMQPVPSTSGPGKLRVVDGTATVWDVDPTGKPTLVVLQALPSLAFVDSGATSLLSGTGGGGSGATLHKFWDTTSGWVASTPYVPKDAPGGAWWLAAEIRRPLVPLWPVPSANAHWTLPYGGTTFVDKTVQPHVTWCALWQKSFVEPLIPEKPLCEGFHFVQRLTYTISGGQASVQDIWASTQGSLGTVPPPRFPPSATGYVKALRTELGAAAPLNMQAIRIGRVLADAAPHVVVSGIGGRVMVLDGNTGRIVRESVDYGLGGMALAIANLDDQGPDEILYAPLYDPIVPGVQSVRSTLRVFGDGGGSALQLLGSVPVGEPGNADFPGYGTCGIAVADLTDHQLDLGKVVIVTTLNGELIVFAVEGGTINSEPLFRLAVEGAIGVLNSIVVADLDPVNTRPEVYLAGSFGIRRFDFQ